MGITAAQHSTEGGHRRRSLGTAEDGADRLGVPVASFHKLRRDALLPPGVTVLVGRRVRVDLDRLDEWISTGGQPFTSGQRKETQS